MVFGSGIGPSQLFGRAAAYLYMKFTEPVCQTKQQQILEKGVLKFCCLGTLLSCISTSTYLFYN